MGGKASVGWLAFNADGKLKMVVTGIGLGFNVAEFNKNGYAWGLKEVFYSNLMVEGMFIGSGGWIAYSLKEYYWFEGIVR